MTQQLQQQESRIDAEPRNPRQPTRADAAEALRSVRRAMVDGSDVSAILEAVEWAHVLTPRRRTIQWVHIDLLISSGLADLAESLLTSALNDRPEDPRLWALNARLFLAQQRLDEAARYARRAVMARSHHVATLLLAAEIELKRCAFHQATPLLHQAAAMRPGDVEVELLLIESLLGEGDITTAEVRLARLRDVPVLLRVRMLQARNQWLEAIDVLEHAIDHPKPADSAEDRDVLITELIHCSETVGDGERINTSIRRVVGSLPNGLDAAGRCLLRRGRIAEATGLFWRLSRLRGSSCEQSEIRQRGLRGLAIAGSLCGRQRLARLALARLSRHATDAAITATATLWRQGLIGQIVSRYTRPTDSSAQSHDDGPSVLRPLVKRAAQILEKRGPRANLEPQAQARVLDQAAVCHAWLGQTDAAISAFGQAARREMTG